MPIRPLSRSASSPSQDVCARRAQSPAGHTHVAELLLDCDGRASALERGPGLVRRLLVDVLKQRLGRAVHQVLGLLQAEAGQGADFLDDLDLLVARGLEDDVELVLLLGLGLGGGGAAAARGRGGHRDRGRGLDVEGLLELLDEVRQLKEGHLLEGVEQVVGAELGHGGHSSVDASSSAAASAAGSSLGVSAGPVSVPDSAVSAGAASAGAVSAGAASACAASAGAVAPPSASSFAWSAPASRAIWTGSALSVAAALVIDAFMAPASMASSTSRDSRSASRSISDGLIDLPSITPPLITRAGLTLAKSRRPLAASTTSPLTNAIAEGPLNSPSSSAAMPASAAASLVKVFLTTLNVACSPSEWRSSASWATVRPRYSASTAPLELWNRSVSSATAATFSALAMGLLSWAGQPWPGARAPAASGVGEGPAKRNAPARGTRARTPRRPRRGEQRSARTPARAARDMRVLRPPRARHAAATDGLWLLLLYPQSTRVVANGGHPAPRPVRRSCAGRRQPTGWASSVRPRVLLGSTGMLGPMVVVMATFLRYRPLAADGLSRRISSMAAA